MSLVVEFGTKATTRTYLCPGGGEEVHLWLDCFSREGKKVSLKPEFQRDKWRFRTYSLPPIIMCWSTMLFLCFYYAKRPKKKKTATKPPQECRWMNWGSVERVVSQQFRLKHSPFTTSPTGGDELGQRANQKPEDRREEVHHEM